MLNYFVAGARQIPGQNKQKAMKNTAILQVMPT